MHNSPVKIVKSVASVPITKLKYLINRRDIIKFQSEINQLKQSSKIIALVMSNAGQQQFFKDVYRLSLEKNNRYYFFLVNECEVRDAEKIDLFDQLKFITPCIYRYITGVDLALHAEIYCRSWDVPNVCYIGHGFPGKHTNWSIENLSSFNNYFLYGPRDRDILKFITKDKPGCLRHINFWEIGYPKYDAQINGSYDEKALAESLGLDPNRKTILFAPAWDPGGALRTHGIELLDRFAAMRNFNIIIKLHPASIVSESSKDYLFYTGGINWLQVLNELSAKHDNIYLYQQQEINPLFKLADVLVTDFSGVAMGFFIEDKPVVTIDCPEYFEIILPSWGQDGETSKSNSLFNNGRNASHLVTDINLLESVINHAIVNRGEMSSARKKIVADLLYNPGKGTENMLAAINRILEHE